MCRPIPSQPATVEVMTADELVVGGGRFTTDTDGYQSMLRYGRQWPERALSLIHISEPTRPN